MARMIFVDNKSIKSFIKKVAGEPIPVEYFFLSKENSGYFVMEAVCHPHPIIKINQYWLNHKNRIMKHYNKRKDGPRFYKSKQEVMKLMLLHEVGHIKVGLTRKKAMNEYLAHMWAIERSKYLGMNKIKNQLEKFIIAWSNYCWNTDKCYRKYILASKMYKNTKRIRL